MVKSDREPVTYITLENCYREIFIHIMSDKNILTITGQIIQKKQFTTEVRVSIFGTVLHNTLNM